MRLFRLTVCFTLLSFVSASLTAQQSRPLPILSAKQQKKVPIDWLVKPMTDKSAVYNSADRKDIILYNGLIKRSFRIAPNIACIDFINLSNGQQLLRAVKPEAGITINGKYYNIGGLKGQKENAYLLPEWVNQFTKGEFLRYEVNPITPFVKWKPTNWATNKKQPGGTMLSFIFQSTLPAGQVFKSVRTHELLMDSYDRERRGLPSGRCIVP